MLFKIVIVLEKCIYKTVLDIVCLSMAIVSWLVDCAGVFRFSALHIYHDTGCDCN